MRVDSVPKRLARIVNLHSTNSATCTVATLLLHRSSRRAGLVAIDRRDVTLTFDECQGIAESILRPLLAAHDEN
jgi:hypothetical protein